MDRCHTYVTYSLSSDFSLTANVLTMRYQPLHQREFRCLRFLEGEDITASLETFDIDALPSHAALSYQWDPKRRGHSQDPSADGNRSIIVDGERCAVQENLFDALQHLSWRAKKWDMPMFVDAICIDQANEAEKGSQVRLMKQIYEKGLGIYGWIGKAVDEDRARLAIKVMRQFNAALNDSTTECNDDWDRIEAYIFTKYSHLFPLSGTETRDGWIGIMEMFDQQYWGRTWIWQEVTGPAPTLFWFGESAFDKYHRSAACYFRYLYGRSNNIHVDLQLKRSISSDTVFALNGFRNVDGRFNKGTTLVELLAGFRRTSSTLAVDKVFAPRNHATDLGPNELIPNYRRSEVEVYIDVVTCYLSKQQNLDILGYVTLVPSDCVGVPMPSWVPDWRVRASILPLYKRTVPRSGFVGAMYSAAGPHTGLEAHLEGTKLALQGARVSRIADILPTPKELDNKEFDKVFGKVRAWFLAKLHEVYEPTGKTIDEALMATMVADISSPDGSDARLQRGGLAEWNTLTQRPRRNSFERTNPWVLEQMCYRRRLAYMESGHVGLVPVASQPNDLICVLFSGSVLYTVRELSDGGFNFIGECYVHGLMDGEFTERPHEVETFWLV